MENEKNTTPVSIPVSKPKPQDLFPSIFSEIKNEISRERMVKKAPEGIPNIVDIQLEASDDTGQYILYAKIATSDSKELVLPYIINKLEKHDPLIQEFDLQHPIAVDKYDIFYLIQFPRK